MEYCWWIVDNSDPPRQYESEGPGAVWVSSGHIREREAVNLILNKSEIQEVLEQAKAAFPEFGDWEYNNEKKKSEYSGFAAWGRHDLSAGEFMPNNLYVTFDTYERNWRGHLTLGQHSYLWSSADVGDAHLLGTGNCSTAGDAIAGLKQEMKALCAVFSIT